MRLVVTFESNTVRDETVATQLRALGWTIAWSGDRATRVYEARGTSSAEERALADLRSAGIRVRYWQGGGSEGIRLPLHQGPALRELYAMPCCERAHET